MSAGTAGISRARDYPVLRHAIPQLSLERQRYRVDFARGPRDLDEVQRMRFEVFNLELGEGLQNSFLTGKDQDDYDLNCHHLRVIDTATDRVVGTYRLQTSVMAARHKGFYSSDEFDLSALPGWMIESSVEVGRACVTREHRNRQALFMLWQGLAAYMTKNKKRFLFGCCSLNTQNPKVGRDTLAYLEQKGFMREDLRVVPRPGHECPDATDANGEPEPVVLPGLFRSYLRFGGRVCGPPAIDRSFKTIDFFVVFDIRQMDRRAYEMFFGRGARS